MSDTAAHLVGRVIPHVPVRQWVLSLPYALRYRLAYNVGTVTAVLGVFVRAVFGDSRVRPTEDLLSDIKRMRPGPGKSCRFLERSPLFRLSSIIS
jgi:hypothetical protein